MQPGVTGEAALSGVRMSWWWLAAGIAVWLLLAFLVGILIGVTLRRRGRAAADPPLGRAGAGRAPAPPARPVPRTAPDDAGGTGAPSPQRSDPPTEPTTVVHGASVRRQVPRQPSMSAWRLAARRRRRGQERPR